VALIETRGRETGRIARAAVGFVDEPDGSLLVAAGDPDADWALNLVAEPHCQVTIGARTMDVEAVELEGPARARAVRDLIIKYGTPSERLGSGPAFRLVPTAEPGGAARER
jgi:deazaflavin-dependent oxidoreductase (nitroreductase family)